MTFYNPLSKYGDFKQFPLIMWWQQAIFFQKKLCTCCKAPIFVTRLQNFAKKTITGSKRSFGTIVIKSRQKNLPFTSFKLQSFLCFCKWKLNQNKNLPCSIHLTTLGVKLYLGRQEPPFKSRTSLEYSSNSATTATTCDNPRRKEFSCNPGPENPHNLV